MSNWGKYIIAAACVLGVGIIYYRVDPSSSVFFPKCPFKMLTGLPCAGCGSQRALHSLLHGDVLQAARYNIMVVILLPILFILTAASCFREKYPKFYLITHSKYISYGLLLMIVVWWVIRIFGFDAKVCI